MNKRDLLTCMILVLATFFSLGISIGLVLAAQAGLAHGLSWLFLFLALALHAVNHIVYWKKYYTLLKSLK